MGERHVPHGDDRLPWRELDGARAVYFTGGDAGALSAARRAGILVAAAGHAGLWLAPASRSTRSCSAAGARRGMQARAM